MAANKNADYEEMDEAEEEALLKSDDELDATRAKVSISELAPPRPEDVDEDSLNEAAALVAANLVDQAGAGAEEGISEYDDDDDEELDESDRVLLEYRNILKELEKNQFAYDKYVRLCELSHSTDDLDNIRKAYNLFASVYPLSPDLWLKYLRIEANVALSSSEIEKVVGLFRRALVDYYSTDLAVEFGALANRSSEAERIWHEILGTYALHCMAGKELFGRYRQYISTNEKMSAKDKQDAYIQSFLRELKYPLFNMEESYIEFKVFHEKNKTQITLEIDWEIIDRKYFKAKEHLQMILPFEEQLGALDVKCYRERAEIYTNYIRKSDKFLDENVLQTVYERMVADCCLNANCWLSYIDFIDYRDEFGRPDELEDLPVFQQDAVTVSNRALRNCTWSEKLFIQRMLLLEKQDKTREEIQEILESSLSGGGFQTAEPAVAIWMEYLTYLRRHTDWENEGECDILRKNFNLAWTILGQQWGVLADCNCEILQFWGRLEYGPLQDAKRGKELWTTVMESSDNSTKSGLWIEFTQLEMRRDLESVRKLYRRALHSDGLDNPNVIASAWERFERCNGNIKTLSSCIKQCSEFRLKSQAHQPKFATQRTVDNKLTSNASGSKPTKRKLATDTEGIPEKKSKTQERDTRAKEKYPAEAKHRESAFKEHETQEIDLTKDHVRIFLSNLDYNLTSEEIRSGLPELKIANIDLIRSANGRSRGFGYLELQSADEVEKALSLDRRALNGRPVFISSVLRDKEKRQSFKYSDGVEPKKLFVKGLPPDATKAELEQVFVAFGKLKDVRLVYHKSGKFKNIAYIEYEDESASGKAIMGTDSTELRGHQISVAISAPPPKSNATASNPSRLLGMNPKRNKVYDQKPRMSLIPHVVRRKLTSEGGQHTDSLQNNTNGTAASAKSNADFRKLLLK